jgi:hypothetical protein
MKCLFSCFERIIRASLAGVLIAAAPSLAGGEPAAPPPPPPAEKMPLSLPLLEPPRSLDLGFRFPTWEQAFGLHHALIMGGHEFIHFAAFQWLPWPPFWQQFTEIAATIAYDFATMRLPLGEGWLHEEGHASIMAINGLGSRQVFNPGSGCNPGSVCGLTDEGIAGVKDGRAADWIRVQEAGMESEIEMSTRVARDVFFHDRPAYQQAPYIFIQNASVFFYRFACAAPDLFTPQDVLDEGPSVDARDFTGPDCTGWVWDLFRPTTPYADRGPHPSGAGLRRFRLFDDLSYEEQLYLRRMRNLALLNFVDPFAFGVGGFEVPSPLGGGGVLKLNATLKHHLTSFGDSLGVNLFLRQDPWKVLATYHSHRNLTGYFPGLTLELRRFPVEVAGAWIRLSAVLAGWLQPRDQDFRTAASAFGGMISLGAAVPVLPFGEAFLRVKAKSPGWVAGDANLDAGAEASLGVNLLL